MVTESQPTPDPTTGKPSRPRRWIPVSLRMFLAILVLVGVGGVPIAVPVFRQDQAIQSVERSGGYVETRGNPNQPSWLLAWVGDRWTRAICPVSIVSCGEKFSDADMAHLPSPESIERLFLRKGKITDAG